MTAAVRVVLASALVGACLWAQGAVVINEVCYDNSSLADENGDKTSDWIELYNNGAFATNVYNFALSDKYDPTGFPGTGGYDESKGVRLPSYWLAPGEFLVVLASTDVAEHTAWTNAPNRALISPNAVWRYLTPSAAPAATWRTNAFNDASWQTGLAPLGYNDAKEDLDCATVLGYGGNSSARYPAAYFRCAFTAYKPWTVTGMVMTARLSDGAVVYLNGREVYRHNMPDGAVAYDTLASSDQPSTLWTTALLATNGMLQGTNVIAVEVHHAAPASSHFVMDLNLTALVGEQIPIVHGSFGLAKEGEKVHLFNNALVRIHEFDPPGYEIGENNSFGLAADGNKSSGQIVFSKPTPGRSNSTYTAPYKETLTNENLSFSVPPGVYAAEQRVALRTATAGLKVYYTLDGSDPHQSASFVYSGNSLTVASLPSATSGIAWVRTNPVEISNAVPTAAWAPPVGGISQGTVVRAVAFSVDGTECSPEIWGTYLIGPTFTNRTLPIVSLIAYTNDLFGFTNGVYVPGKAYADSPKGYGDNRWGKPYANYHQDSSDAENWERPVKFELLEPAATTPAVAQTLGVTMHGGGTRALPEKTLYLLARLGEYGTDRVNYKLFPDEEPASYKRFLLRNSGNDWYGPDTGVATMMKDAVFHRLVKGLDISVMAYRPAVAYINGQYWGLHNLRESFDKHYLATRYGVDADSCDILMHEEDSDNPQKVVITRIDGDKSADNDYEALIGWVSSNSLSVAANYQQLQTYIDVTNLADYVVAETFFGNTDWPINNCDFWRTHTNQVATCGKYGDTRWRWMLYDLDVSGEQGADYDMFDYLSDKDMVDVNEPGFLINKLWKNMEYRNYFVTRYASLLNTTFRPERTSAVIAEAARAIAPEMETHFRRWGRTFTQAQWQSSVNTALVQYAAARHAVLWSHLNAHFHLGGTGALTVRNSDPDGVGGHFVVNGIDIETATDGVTNRAAWTGTYFQSLGVAVKAVPDAGYVFARWEDDAAAGAERTVFVSSAPQTFTARFLPVGAHIVTFDPQGGTVAPLEGVVTVGQTYGTLPTPTRGGYTFAGWWTEAGGGAQITATTTVALASDQTLYAHWTANAYAVTFDAQGGSVTPASQSVTNDATYGALPTPTRGGYTFAGWWTEMGGGSQITATATVALVSDQTLYAHWTANAYTVTFDAQGGSVVPANQSVTFDSAYGVLPTPTRGGYTFTGWWTDSSGGTEVTAEDVVSVAADQTLYAHWTTQAYTVTFDARGGSVTPASKRVAFDAAYGALPTPTRSGYTFTGWWTEIGGGAQITVATIVALTADQTLYAHWTANAYTVTFDAQGGSVTPASQSVTFNAAYGTLPTPTRTGYLFSGWWTDAGGGAQITAAAIVSTAAAHTLYAHWTARTFTVTFDAQGGAVTPASKSVTFGAAYGALPTPTRYDYTFSGWRTEADGAGTPVTADAVVATANDQTLFASWTPVFHGSITRTIVGSRVTLTVTPAQDATAWSCTESIPEGLRPLGVTGPNAGWDGYPPTSIQWEGVGSTVATLSYGLTGNKGAYTLSGTADFDGVSFAVGGESNVTVAAAAAIPGWRYPRCDRAGTACSAESTTVPVTATLAAVSFVTNVTGQILTGDVDGDGELELVMADGELRAVRGDGQQKWFVSLPQTCFAAMLEDVDGDGVLDIGLGSAGAAFSAYLYNGVGAQLKAFPGQHASGADASVAPIGFTGATVLMGYNATSTNALPRGVACFDCLSGAELWYAQVGPTNGNVFSVADADGDGLLDATMRSATVNKGVSGSGTTDRAMCLVSVNELGNVTLAQNYASPSNGVADHVFADLDGDGVCEIVGFESHDAVNKGVARIHVYATTGVEKAVYSGTANIGWTSYAIGDLAGDAGLEIVATTSAGEKTALFDGALNKLIEKSGLGYVKLLCDLDGDGVRDVVTMNDKGLLRVLDSRLNVIASAQAGSKMGAVIASDVNGDGVVEILCRSDRLYTFAFKKLTAPIVAKFAIDNGAAATADRTVALNNTCSNAPTYYMASESATFEGADWHVYSAAPAFLLSDGPGDKTVYFKVKNASGESAVVSDTISQPQAKPVITRFVLAAGAAGTNSRTVTLDNDCTGVPTEYQVSLNSGFDNNTAAWLPYTQAPTYQLPSGKGNKTVYFRVRNSLGVSASKSDAIALDEGAVWVTAAAQPAEGGSVTGGGALLYAGKTLTLTAKPAAGWVFAGWDNGSLAAARTVVVAEDTDSNGVIQATAAFKPLSELALPEIANPGAQSALVGVAFKLPLAVSSDSLPTVSVAGLPTGLSYSAAAMSIVGVPKKTGTYRITLTVSNAKGAAVPQVFVIAVTALPAWAQGAFNGEATAEELGSGTIAMNVTAQGGVSGKLALKGTNYTFTAASYASIDEAGALRLACTAKVSKVSFPMTLSVSVPAPVAPATSVPPTLGKAVGTLNGGGSLTLYRSVWKDAGLSVAATNWTGYYTATLPGGDDFGSGYLAMTVDAVGGVKSAGKLADGTALSLSGPLILDEAGRVWTVLYAAPTAYKGGFFFGVAEWAENGEGLWIVKPRDTPFAWTSQSPQATGEYGVGFVRELGLSGGWYNKLANLYNYYRGLTLSVGTASGAAAPVLSVGTNAYASAWWNPDGLTLTPVTNRFGVMTGLAAPAAGAPTSGAGGYEYASGTNTVGLSISLTTATGAFKGSFKAWFDYPGTHTSKSLSFEGLLTPVREGGDAEGRGFFLWGRTGSYQNASGRATSYSFSESYDFLLLGD